MGEKDAVSEAEMKLIPQGLRWAANLHYVEGCDGVGFTTSRFCSQRSSTLWLKQCCRGFLAKFNEQGQGRSSSHVLFTVLILKRLT